MTNPEAENNDVPKKISIEADGVKQEEKAPEPQERRVLVVEDSKPLRRMLVKIMETQKFTVEEAENGKVALATLKLRGPDFFNLLVVDLMMPVMDGAHFISEARSAFGDKMPPVLICSSRSDRETITLVMKLGVSGYVLKPFKTETVINKVQEVLAAVENAAEKS